MPKPPKPTKAPRAPDASYEQARALFDAVESLEGALDEIDDFSTKTLFKAAAGGDVASLEEALEMGASPDAVLESTGESALFFAVASGSADAVRALLAAGAHADMACELERKRARLSVSPLVLARYHRHAAIADLLVAAARGRAPRNAPTEAEQRESDLRLAVYFGDVARVEECLSAGASPNARLPESGDPVLLLAIDAGAPEVVRALLHAGADPNADRNYRGGRRSALAWARVEEAFELVRHLVAAGARYVDTYRRKAPAKRAAGPADAKLGAAVAKGDAQAAEEHLMAGADPNGVTAQGEPFLAIAVRRGDVAMVRLLLENEAYPDVEAEGVPVLHLAVKQGDARTVKALLDESADPNRRAGDRSVGDALLGLDAKVQATVLRRLLRHGLDPDTRVVGTPLLLHALRARALASVELLLNHGADVNRRGASGEGAIDALGALSSPEDEALLARLRERGLG